MTTPTELKLSIEYAERALVCAEEDVAYYTERLAFVTGVRDRLREQIFTDKGRLARAESAAAQRTRVAES